MLNSSKAPRAAIVVAAALLAASIAPAATGFAQDAAAASDPAVLAMVGGEPITETDLMFAAEDLGQDLANVPVDQRRGVVLSMLIDMKVMAQAARAAHMDQTASYLARQAYLEERALRRAYFEEVIVNSVTDEELQAAYQEAIAGFVPQEEIHARHILVASEADANAIAAQLQEGADFAELARENSTDASGPGGGDLGFFRRGDMIPVFEQYAFALQPGQVSVPFESQFGWHIVKVDEARLTPVPSFEQMEAQLRQQVLYAKFDEMVGTLKADAEIEIIDPTLAPSAAAEQPAAEQPAAQ